MASNTILGNTGSHDAERNDNELKHSRTQSVDFHSNKPKSEDIQKNEQEFKVGCSKESASEDYKINEPITKDAEQNDQEFKEPVSEDPQNKRQKSHDPLNIEPEYEDSKRNEQEFENTQNNKPIAGDTDNKDRNNDGSKSKDTEERESEGKTSNESAARNHHSPIAQILVPDCGGIRERIELLNELLASKKLDSVPEVYDEMAQIIAATERNARLQTGTDGERLLELTTAAVSNRNVDLHNLDVEIERQFGLHSVEVTGDGACAFRATLISGMQRADSFHSELRENVIKQVLSNMAYYSTVLRPGEKVSEKELKDWTSTMADPNTYGDEMANMALADRYHIQLAVFRAGELLSVVNPRDGHVKNTAFLVNVGTHYKALVPRYDLEEARRNSERLCK